MKSIKKIHLWKIQRDLKLVLKPNFTSLGIDIALRVTGWALLKTDNDYLYFIDKGIIDTTKEKWITAKLDKIEDELNKIKIEGENKIGVIEMPFVGINKRGAIVLGIAAGTARSIIRKRIPYNFFLSAVEARKRLGIKPANCKKVVAQKWIKNNFKIDESEDIIDAFALGVSSLIDLKKTRYKK